MGNARIRLRRDEAAAWVSANPVLASGEAGYETDTGKLKVGDGVTAWNTLVYLVAAGGLVEGDIDTLAKVNAILTDATLIDTGDARLSDARAPTVHASEHVTGGSDKLRDATAAQDGLMTLAYAGKLDGIAASANNYVHPNHTGDVTSTGDGATVIANSVVTLAKQADMATASVVYRKTAGAGAPEVQTLATLKTDLGLTGTNSGDQTSIVGITGTTAEFNTALSDGSFATGGGTATGTNTGDNATNTQYSGLVSNATHTGDATGATELTIANNVVSNAKLADMATKTMKGRTASGTGDPEDLTAAQVRAIVGDDLAIVTDSTTAISLSADNAYPSYIRTTNGGAITLTLLAGQTAFGRHWIIRQAEAGVSTVAAVDSAAAAVTLNGDAKTAGQHTEIAVVLTADKTLDIIGGAA